MLQVARLAPKVLGAATERVAEFLRDGLSRDGVGADRAGESDIYYSVFALEALAALRVERPIDAAREWLADHGAGEDLDLVHLCALARSYASLDAAVPEPVAERLARRLGSHRSTDGGFAGTPGERDGTIYHAFLALCAYQDLGRPIPDAERLADAVLERRCADGSFTNHPIVPIGNTPSTAAALTVLRLLDRPRPDRADDWLVARVHPKGGFAAAPAAPIPDLLSTATALHALSGPRHGDAIDAVREPCLDFVDTLWTGRAFCGSWEDETPDAEYTWYALLALGHLST